MSTAISWKRGRRGKLFWIFVALQSVPTDQFVAPPRSRSTSFESSCSFCPVPSFVSHSQLSSTPLHDEESCQLPVKPHETGTLNSEIARLCQANLIDEAMELLTSARDALINCSADFAFPNTKSFNIILSSLAKRSSPNLDCERINRIFQNQAKLAASYEKVAPNQESYLAVITAYSKSNEKNASKRCVHLLDDLLLKYEESERNVDLMPTFPCFVSTLSALARSGTSWRTAEKAQGILSQMETLSASDENLAHLAPDRKCYNIVLTAWSKSRAKNACERCESLLQTMTSKAAAGHHELHPDTISFNVMLDALAYSRDYQAPSKAEALLERMNELSKTGAYCKPDIVSFNSVLNAWSRSKDRNAAERADCILQHMEERYNSGETSVQPDSVSYHAVLSAYARSKNRTSLGNARKVLERMKQAFENGNALAEPNVMSYNILINAMAESREPAAAQSALNMLEAMKTMGTESCLPDCVTYTTVMGVLAKRSDHADVKSIELLEELESMYFKTGDKSLKPTIKTYTAVSHAIARSRKRPDRAEAIVSRLEEDFESGNSDVQPDCALYHTILNAYAWSSDVVGKSKKCYSIYKKMLQLYRSRQNPLAKPDIVTCNSVLNACAHETVDTDKEHKEIMDILVRTVEEFESNAPQYGWPNHITSFTTIQAISRHVFDLEKRAQLAEATFWKCASRGQVSIPVIVSLYKCLSWERFSEILGTALQSKRDERLLFDWHQLPKDWRKFAPEPKRRRQSKPSCKQERIEKPSMHRINAV